MNLMKIKKINYNSNKRRKVNTKKKLITKVKMRKVIKWMKNLEMIDMILEIKN